jgi:hypothetical protein
MTEPFTDADESTFGNINQTYEVDSGSREVETLRCNTGHNCFGVLYCVYGLLGAFFDVIAAILLCTTSSSLATGVPLLFGSAMLLFATLLDAVYRCGHETGQASTLLGMRRLDVFSHPMLLMAAFFLVTDRPAGAVLLLGLAGLVLAVRAAVMLTVSWGAISDASSTLVEEVIVKKKRDRLTRAEMSALLRALLIHHGFLMAMAVLLCLAALGSALFPDVLVRAFYMLSSLFQMAAYLVIGVWYGRRYHEIVID